MPNSQNEIPLTELPPGVLITKCHRDDVRDAAAGLAFMFAKAEAKLSPLVRRQVFLVTEPANFAKSTCMRVHGSEPLEIEPQQPNQAQGGDDEEYPIKVESSGLSFTLSTFEYLDRVVAGNTRPIVVIDGFDRFATKDGGETSQRLMDYAQERGAIIVGLEWPRSARKRHSS